MKKVIFISGGSQGIGKAISEKLASEDSCVVVGFKSNREKAKVLVDKIKKNGNEAKSIFCDISNRKSIKEAFDEIGTIDVLVNNASISQHKDFLDISDEDWSKMLNINLQGAFMCSQIALPGMIKNKWGRIINISSIGGQWGGVNQAHYASAKAGLIGLTMSLARIYSSMGVTANSISPGIIETKMTAWLSGREKDNLVENIPVGRFGTATEVAEVVEFLASNNSSYITGQTINVNGGMLRS